jgi:UDP-N-acetylglucosamine acyltransferase
MTIHPTAVVDPEARIAPDVVVGPYCVIGPDVTIASGCRLQNHVTICGPVKIGAGNRFYSYCSIGQQTQDLKYDGEPTYLEIGDNNSFREFVTVNRATAAGSRTRVGNRGNFLAYSHIAHDCVVEDDVIFSNNGTLGGHVLVQQYAIVGGLTAIHQFCRIGKFSIMGGCSKIVQDVPPFMIADGNPAVIRGINYVGLERHSVSHEVIRVLKESHRILYRSDLNTKQAVAELDRSFSEVPEVRELVEFIEKSERGIIR